MKQKAFFLILAFTALVGMLSPRLVSADSSSDYPYQGHSGFLLDAVVTAVDTDRDRVTVKGDDGQRYTVDTYRSDIVLRDTGRHGETGDLVPGMRLHIAGVLLSSDIIEAAKVRVLPITSHQTGPVGPRSPAGADGDSITLRGTVDKVDQRNGSFVVRVRNHARTVLLTENTDIRDLRDGNQDNPSDIPLRRGDRVTVSGILREDGAVIADLVARSRTVTQDPYRDDRLLTGRVTDIGNRYLSRDIKIRLNSDREIKIHVPSGTPVRRDGQPISVHELSKDDVVRVFGTYEGSDFKASRIEVTQTIDAEN